MIVCFVREIDRIFNISPKIMHELVNIFYTPSKIQTIKR